MPALDRIKGLIAKAQDAAADNKPGSHVLLLAYTQCAKIITEELEADAPVSGEVTEAILQFCKQNCFYSRKDGQGSSSECQICPLAPYALDNVDVEETDDVDLDAVRAKRAGAEARAAMRRLDERGVDTNASYERHVRRGNMGLRPADGDDG